jgi:hypothetical protein
LIDSWNGTEYFSASVYPPADTQNPFSGSRLRNDLRLTYTLSLSSSSTPRTCQIPKWNELERILFENIQSAVLGKKTSAQAMADANAQMNGGL